VSSLRCGPLRCGTTKAKRYAASSLASTVATDHGGMPRVLAAETTIDRLARWAKGRDNVRSLIVTSTRAIPGAHVDAYSDYDVVAVVEDVRAMLDDTRWQADFGEVLISYWDPVEADPSTGAEWVGNITNYTSGLKIDFSLWSPQHYADVTAGPDPYPEFDAGYRVVVDKDGLTTGLPGPTFSSSIFSATPIPRTSSSASPNTRNACAMATSPVDRSVESVVRDIRRDKVRRDAGVSAACASLPWH
jgi:hypothetical protein